MKLLNKYSGGAHAKSKSGRFNKSTVFKAAVVAMAVLVAMTAVVYNLKRGVKVEFLYIQPASVASKISTTGTVRSGAEKSYYVLANARVSALNVKVGDYVNAGDMLAAFSSDDIDANVMQLKYQWETSEAEMAKGANAINVLKSTIANIDKEISSLSRQLGSSAVSSVGGRALRAEFLTETGGADGAQDVLKELDSLEGVDDETKILFAQLGTETTNKVGKALSGNYGSTDAEIIDAVNSALSNAEKKLEAAIEKSNDKLRKQLQLLLLKQQKNILNGQVPSVNELNHLQAAAAAAKAAYEAADSQAVELKNGWTAEFSGVVAQVNIEQGEIASAGMVGIVIVDPNILVVDIDLGKYDAEKVKAGQPATVFVKDAEIPGTVTFVSPVAREDDENTVLSCRVAVSNPDSRLIMGFDVDVDIQTAKADYAVVIPLSAVKNDELGKYCYKFNPEEHTAVKTYIDVGITNENSCQVLIGVNFGDAVILNPSDKIYDGVRVRLYMPEAPTSAQSGLPTVLYTVPETTWPNNFGSEETFANEFGEQTENPFMQQEEQGNSSIDL